MWSPTWRSIRSSIWSCIWSSTCTWGPQREPHPWGPLCGAPYVRSLKDMLTAHNTVRTRVGIPALNWSPGLEHLANEYVSTLVNGGCLKMYIYVCGYSHTYTHIYIAYMHICIHIYIYICTYMCVYIYTDYFSFETTFQKLLTSIHIYVAYRSWHASVPR